MSRRYGRNQKRRHRAEIMRLTEANKMNLELGSHLTDKLKKSQETIFEMIKTVEAVCYNSVTIPPKTVTGVDRRDFYRVGCFDPPDLAVNDYSVPVEKQMRTVNMWALREYLEHNAEQFQTAVHLDYTAGKHSCYIISESALQQMPAIN